MKIAIEGMDGVGKTTIALELAKRNNFKYIGNAIHTLFGITKENSEYYKFFQDKEDEIFLKSGNDILRAWLCSLGNIYTMTQKKYENIIIDRHILSNFQQNGTEENIAVYEALLKLIGIPDMTVILYASPEIRMKRIYQRNKNDKDLQNEKIKISQYNKMIKTTKIPYIVINTEEREIEEIVKEIEEIIINKEKKVIKKYEE